MRTPPARLSKTADTWIRRDFMKGVSCPRNSMYFVEGIGEASRFARLLRNKGGLFAYHLDQNACFSGDNSRIHRQATMNSRGKTAGLILCGSRNEKQMTKQAAKNANHKYHRRKAGRRLANNSQRPAARCKGISHKRL